MRLIKQETAQRITGNFPFLALLLALALVSSPVAAQEEWEELEAFLVTGSRISRIEAETSSPMITIDRKQIEQTGYQTVSDLIRSLPYQSGFAFDEKFVNSFAPGSSGVSLRGLGQNATLVLVNGRRMANYGFAQNSTDSFVDLNSIPLAAIERVEVLKTGASAIYGSDAIAGVINVITRRDYNGVSASATYSDTSRRDMDEFAGSVSAGVTSAKGNFMVTADYYRRSNLHASDRFFSETVDQANRMDGVDYRSFWGSPGWIFLNGQFLTLPGADGFATPGRPTADEVNNLPPGIPLYDYAPFTDLIPQTERYSFNAMGEYDLTRDLRFFTSLIYRKVETESLIAPTPDTAFFGGRQVAADNPFNPLDVPFTYGYRFVDHGSRIRDLDTDVGRALIGLRGNFGDGWNWEMGYVWNRSKTSNIGRNYHSDPAVRSALASTDEATALNIFGSNLHLKDALTIETIRIGDSRLSSIDFFVDNPSIAELPGGSVGFAAGVEYRDEQVEDLADSFSASGQVVASGGSSADGKRHLYAAYAEVVVPVTRLFEIDAAVRHENYSDFGTTTKPRLGAKFRVLDSLMLRAVFDQGFRAPSLAQLYLGETISFPQVVDPKRPSDQGNVSRAVAGGNPDLQPEESETYSLGFLFEPDFIPGFIASLDYLQIKHDDVIDSLGVNFIVNNEDILPGLVVREPFQNNAVDQAAGNTAGPISFINDSYGNFGQRKVEFIDLELNYQFTADAGRFEFFSTITHMLDYKQQFRPGEDFVQLAGTNWLPEWRGNVGANWVRGDLSATLILNYIHNFGDPSRDTPVGSFYEVNPQFTYSGFWDSRLTVGVQNLLDRRPPWSANRPEGYEFAVHSPVMRRAYVRVSKDF